MLGNVGRVHAYRGDHAQAVETAATAVSFRRAADAIVVREEALAIAERLHLPGTERIRVLPEQTRRT